MRHFQDLGSVELMIGWKFASSNQTHYPEYSVNQKICFSPKNGAVSVSEIQSYFWV